MGEKFKKIGKYIARHKYLCVILIFLVVVGFLDSNSFLYRYELYCHNEALRKEILKYEEIYAQDTRKLQELENNPMAVERVARMHLFMKTANEDVYILE